MCVHQFAQKHFEHIKRVMIIDFDAHQGNGHERDFIEDNSVYIVDMYNRWIYPGDTFARCKEMEKLLPNFGC